MKKWNDIKKVIILFIISTIALVSMIIFWSNDVLDLVIEFNKIAFVILGFFAIMLTFTSIIVIIGSLEYFIVCIILEFKKKKYEKEYNIMAQEVKKRLSEKTSIVTLKNPNESTFVEGIPNKDIDFYAHLDKNDNIVLVVQINSVELEINDYEWFVKRFDF